MLKDAEVVEALKEPAMASSQDAALDRARNNYDSLRCGDLFERGRRLRNDGIAHLLIPDDPTPTVTYETIYSLHDAAEQLVANLYHATGHGDPKFLGHKTRLQEHARVFWDTYFRGMDSAPCTSGP